MNNKVAIILVILFAVVMALIVLPKNFKEENTPIIEEIRRRLAIINPRFGRLPMRTGDKSYTEDKHYITLCTIDPHTGNMYNINVLMYVTLHEVAHTLTKADGDLSHADEFKQNFAKLLKEAAMKGVYDPSQPIPVTYCGVDKEHSH
jgi:hypothetical protein